MSVYSTQFFLGTLAVAVQTLYTVPAGMTVVVRDIELSQGGTGPAVVTIWGQTVPGAQAYLVRQSALAPNVVFQWQGRSVLQSGQTLQAFCNAANTELWISGYLLSP